MTKYSFILLGEETENFLQQLQELGIVDITRSKKPIDSSSSALLEEAEKQKRALKVLSKADYTEDPDVQDITAASEFETVDGDPSDCVLAADARIAELLGETRSVERIRKDRLVWGSFDKAALDSLQDLGLKVRFYNVAKKKYDPAWEEQFAIQVVSENDSNVWFVTVTPENEEYNFPATECVAPDCSCDDAQARLREIHQEIVNLKGRLLKAKEYVPDIERCYCDKLTDLDRYLAGATKETAVDDRVTVMEGFSPTASDAELCAKLDEMGIFYIKEEAVLEDNPPIKLKNNKFASMFEVLTGMYGMPVYNEFDPTVILGPFFLLFFALCMGDAGYGILLMGISYLLKTKFKSMANLAPLVMTLGIGTFVVGIFLGTFFGINLNNVAWLPDWLKTVMINNRKVAGYDFAMVLAVGIGVLHICLAMVLKTIVFTRRFGFMKTISTWGWTILIVGGVIVAGLALTEVISSGVTKIVVIVIGVVSALGIYIFNNPKRNPLLNIGSGLWDTYNMATGLLGDTLSYVRLYALGLAGGMLGAAFNTLGLMVFDCGIPGVNILFCIVILIIGHALNLAMSILGAFVHPLRLTFVEFFKNSGYSGQGKEYNPLTVKNEEAL